MQDASQKHKIASVLNCKLIKKDIIFSLFLLLIAFSLRVIYQNESVIFKPIRADAREYFSVAYNLKHFGVYSSAFTLGEKKPPESDFNRSPGYPLFLYPFLMFSENLSDFLEKVTLCQALMSSTGVVLTYILGRMFMSPLWAFVAGLLTALSPHLIAMDHYLLSESLFTFILLLSVLMLTIGIRLKKKNMYFFSGCLFGFSTLVRPVSLFLVAFLGIVFWIKDIRKKHNHRFSLKILIVLISGFVVVYLPYYLLKYTQSGTEDPNSGREVWEHLLRGSDPFLKHFLISKSRMKNEYTYDLARSIQDRSYAIKNLKKKISTQMPTYLSWYLGGKLCFAWRWDNIYIGDVYQYPMVRKGFETNLFLKGIHRIFFYLHWPIFLVALLTMMFFLFINRFRRSLKESVSAISVIVFTPVYFFILLSILMPLPRYAIPLRPFVYLIAILGLKEMVFQLKFKSNI